MDAKQFLADAHRNGHKGPFLLKRWAMRLNTDRRNPARFISTATLEEAIALETAEEEGRLAL